MRIGTPPSFPPNFVRSSTRSRRLSGHYLTEPPDDLGEHRDIADAVIARKTDDAVYLTRKHYMRTVEILLQYAPELFTLPVLENACKLWRTLMKFHNLSYLIFVCSRKVKVSCFCKVGMSHSPGLIDTWEICRWD